MTIPITQTDLNRVGYQGNFSQLPWSQRRNVAAEVLTRLGRTQEAMLLQINNPNAIRGITYINNTPLRTR